MVRTNSINSKEDLLDWMLNNVIECNTIATMHNHGTSPACPAGTMKQFLMQSLCLLGNLDQSYMQTKFQEYYNASIKKHMFPGSKLYEEFLTKCVDTKEGREMFGKINNVLLKSAFTSMIKDGHTIFIIDEAKTFLDQEKRDYKELIKYIGNIIAPASVSSSFNGETSGMTYDTESDMSSSNIGLKPVSVAGDDNDCSCVIF